MRPGQQQKRSQKSAPTTSKAPKNEEHSVVSDPSGVEQMPMTTYISIVGVHTTLLGFAALFLPRSAVLQTWALFDEDMGHISSLDHPQYPFLDALTVRPVLTMASVCLGAAIIQTWWSDWLRRWWIDSMIRGTGEEKNRQKHRFTKQRLLALLRVYGTVIIASFLIHAILVLFGAPITSLIFKTYLLALLVSILTVLPPAYLFGVPTFRTDSASFVRRWTWIRLFAELSFRNPIERAIVYPIVGTSLGGWLGVIPIALDWDRPWQAWPLTPAYGAVCGYILSSVVALTANAIALITRKEQSALPAGDSNS